MACFIQSVQSREPLERGPSPEERRLCLCWKAFRKSEATLMQPQRLQGYGMIQSDHAVEKSIRGLRFGRRKMSITSGDPVMVHFRTDMSSR